jgi:hypothetical protein
MTSAPSGSSRHDSHRPCHFGTLNAHQKIAKVVPLGEPCGTCQQKSAIISQAVRAFLEHKGVWRTIPYATGSREQLWTDAWDCDRAEVCPAEGCTDAEAVYNAANRIGVRHSRTTRMLRHTGGSNETNNTLETQPTYHDCNSSSLTD